MHQVLRFAEVAAPYLKQDGLEMGLPLCLCDSLGVLHDLSCSLVLASHLKMLGLLEHRQRHLLLRQFIAVSLNYLL